jgi:hypothetical protein
MAGPHKHPIACFAERLVSQGAEREPYFCARALHEIYMQLLNLNNIDERLFAQNSLVVLAAQFGEVKGQWTAANALIGLVRRSGCDALLSET